MASILAIALSACARRAPQPGECMAAAERFSRLTEVREEWTLRCLTEGFDRNYVRCLGSTRYVASCRPPAGRFAD
jgi:hypothetical protein